ncbi:MAG: GNAT family N-acetyltransferase [Anaerolineae bacterium]|nr:GNAT family N-acetyltransferase [Anaerolineae bacterium]
MTQELTVRGAAPEEYPKVADLCARCFKGGAPWESYERLYDIFFKYSLQSPNFAYDHVRTGWLGDKVVSHVRVFPYEMYYGKSTLTVGGVGGVCTDEAYRRRHYASAVMRDSLRHMAGIGCDISALHSGPIGYYTRFGYACAWPFYMLRFVPHDLDMLAADKADGVTVRPVTEDDYPEMLALYNRDYAERPASATRTVRNFAWRLDGDFPRTRAAVGADGRLRGYLAGWHWMNTGEVVTADEAATAALLLDIVADAKREAEGKDEAEARELLGKPFWWIIPPDVPAARHARALCPVSTISYTRPAAEWMACIVNLESTMQELLPELEAQWARSPYARWTGSLRLETDMGDVTLASLDGKLALDERAPASRVVRMNQTGLVKLIFAYAPPEEIIAAGDIEQLDDEAAGMLKALFPPRICHLAYIDEY